LYMVDFTKCFPFTNPSNRAIEMKNASRRKYVSKHSGDSPLNYSKNYFRPQTELGGG
jgi:hypothetical protein